MIFSDNIYFFSLIESFTWFQFLTSLIILLIGINTYLRIAKKWQIVDRPNERSSHQKVTIRGGGIVYSIAVLLFSFFFLNFDDTFMLSLLGGAIVLSVVSFIDDIKDLSAKLRLGIHLMVLCIAFWQIFFNLDYSWILIIAVFGLSVVMMNGYNFMDGINGISFQMTLSVSVGLLILNDLVIRFVDSRLLVLITLANLIFGYFNFRKKAICFMGDIGSITLGFIFVVLCVKLGVALKSFSPILILMVYFLDVVSTMIQRLVQGENILKPHRKHLYQLLVNEFRMSHLLVSALYFIVQTSVILVWWLVFGFDISTKELLLILGTYLIFYWLIKAYLLKKLSAQSLMIS